MLPCARCVRLNLECSPPVAVQRGRPSRLRLMQRNLEQQTLAGNAGLGMVADDSGNTHLLKDRIAMPQQPQMCFLQPVQIAELQQPEPGGAIIVQACTPMTLSLTLALRP